MANPNLNALDVKDTLLHQSWQSEAWMPILNPSNVLEYFAESIFYERQCNNEIIRMQRLNPDQMLNMVGPEYVLLIAQEPILYVIRKQHRTSPTQVGEWPNGDGRGRWGRGDQVWLLPRFNSRLLLGHVLT